MRNEPGDVYRTEGRTVFLLRGGAQTQVTQCETEAAAKARADKLNKDLAGKPGAAITSRDAQGDST